MYYTITTNNFFRNVHQLIKVKVHFHHSDTTGKVLDYSHDFCNSGVCENKSEIPMIAHNLFGFDMFFSQKVIKQLHGVKKIQILLDQI